MSSVGRGNRGSNLSLRHMPIWAATEMGNCRFWPPPPPKWATADFVQENKCPTVFLGKNFVRRERQAIGNWNRLNHICQQYVNICRSRSALSRQRTDDIEVCRFRGVRVNECLLVRFEREKCSSVPAPQGSVSGPERTRRTRLNVSF